jgi:hypothetical protein
MSMSAKGRQTGDVAWPTATEALLSCVVLENSDAPISVPHF